MKKTALLLSAVACAALLSSTAAHAVDSRANGPGQAQPFGGAGKAVPFGGAYSATRDGKRPQDAKRPSATTCALREQTRGIGTTRQDASGKVQLFNDPASLNNRKGDIYGDCDTGARALNIRGSASRPTSAYTRGNTLKAATDGYVNRSATSSMMPKKAPSMYDPATGTLKPRKRPNAYQIYQE